MDKKQINEQEIPYWVSLVDGTGKRIVLSIWAVSADQAITKALEENPGSHSAYTA